MHNLSNWDYEKLVANAKYQNMQLIINLSLFYLFNPLLFHKLQDMSNN